jgi:hypothetical protein
MVNFDLCTCVLIFVEQCCSSQFHPKREAAADVCLGCVLCIVGSTVIILHAPEEEMSSSMEQI